MMVRSGKERVDTLDDEATQVTIQEGRWRAGVNRQSQPSAQEHQRAAGLASGAKHKENAMSEKESKARKAAHKVEVRARQKAAREQAAAAAAAEKEVSLHQFNDMLEEAYLEEHPDSADDFHELTLGEWDAFRAWVAEQPEGNEFALDCCMEFYNAWRSEGSPDPSHAPSLPPQPKAVPALRPAPPAPPGDDPEDPFGEYSADCFYEGPNDHNIAERHERRERLRREQPGYVQLTLQPRSRRTFTAVKWTVKVQLQVIQEDYNDGYELDQDRWVNEDGRRSHFYGVPAGDLPSSAAAPFGCVPTIGLPAGKPATVPQPHRDNVAVYGPLANNPDGDRAFRTDRALWYESVTHQRLTGTVTEQWQKVDAVARSFRVDNTRSGRRPSETCVYP